MPIVLAPRGGTHRKPYYRIFAGLAWGNWDRGFGRGGWAGWLLLYSGRRPLNAGIAALEWHDMTDTITAVDHSTDNVFADLGVPEPESQFLKAQLVARLAAVLKDQDLTQADAALKRPANLLLRNSYTTFSGAPRDCHREMSNLRLDRSSVSCYQKKIR